VTSIDPAVSAVAALGTALLFAAAALHKLADWSRFGAALAGYRLAPEWLVPGLAVAVVALEIAAAALLPVLQSRPAGALLAAVLLASYAVVIGVNLRRGRTSIDCGCFGPGARNPIGPWMVVRNVLLAVLVLTAALPVSSRSLTALDALTIGGAVTCLAILYAAQEVLQRVAPRSARSAGT
jgi:Methylamine utilisation protein MauE